MYNTTHYKCKTLHTINVQHYTLTMYNTTHYQCTTLHTINVQHYTLSIYNTTHYQCTTLHTINVQHYTLSMYKTKHYQCTTLHTITPQNHASSLSQETSPPKSRTQVYCLHLATHCLQQEVASKHQPTSHISLKNHRSNRLL